MALSQGRDVAVIILMAELFVLSLVPLAGTYLAVRGLQRLMPHLMEWLRTARAWALRAELIVRMLMRWLLAPILVASSLTAGVREGIAVLRRR